MDGTVGQKRYPTAPRQGHGTPTPDSTGGACTVHGWYQVWPKVGPGTGGVGTPIFGINYGSISFGQLSGYIVFCILLIGGASPPI